MSISKGDSVIHTRSDGIKVEYSVPTHKNAGMQKVHTRRNLDYPAIGTWRNYGGWGAGASREPNTGRQVAFQRVEGKIKGVVKRDGCVVYA